jgi:hypothetical protein
VASILIPITILFIEGIHIFTLVFAINNIINSWLRVFVSVFIFGSYTFILWPKFRLCLWRQNSDHKL